MIHKAHEHTGIVFEPIYTKFVNRIMRQLIKIKIIKLFIYFLF